MCAQPPTPSKLQLVAHCALIPSLAKSYKSTKNSAYYIYAKFHVVCLLDCSPHFLKQFELHGKKKKKPLNIDHSW